MGKMSKIISAKVFIVFLLSLGNTVHSKPVNQSEGSDKQLGKYDSLWGFSSKDRKTIKIKTNFNETITAVDVDGLAYVGDMILGFTKDLELHGLQIIDPSRKSFADERFDPNAGIIYPRSGGVWPNGVVPYVFASNLSNQSRRDMEYAINHWNTRTNLRFVPRTDERDYLEIQNGGGCSSWIGKRGGRQTVNLANGCGRGAAVHELGHAVGFFHEQTRIDRDDYVDIIWNNIRQDMAFNFEKMTTRDGTTDGRYDFRSIMHYRRDAFSTNGRDTIVPKADDIDIDNMGRGSVLSAGDIAAAATLYGDGGDPPVEATLETDKERYDASESIVVSFSDAVGDIYDWIGIYQEGAANDDYLSWQFLDGEINGSRRFSPLPQGKYEARLFFFDSYNLEASTAFEVVSGTPEEPEVRSLKTVYEEGERITIEFRQASGNVYDWIGLYRRNASNPNYIDWKYLRQQKNGSTSFPALPAGEYSARLFFNDSYRVEAEADFRVE